MTQLQKKQALRKSLEFSWNSESIILANVILTYVNSPFRSHFRYKFQAFSLWLFELIHRVKVMEKVLKNISYHQNNSRLRKLDTKRLLKFAIANSWKVKQREERREMLNKFGLRIRESPFQMENIFKRKVM